MMKPFIIYIARPQIFYGFPLDMYMSKWFIKIPYLSHLIIVIKTTDV